MTGRKVATLPVDANGNPTAVTNRSGQVISAIYDLDNRLTSRTYAGATNTVFKSTWDDANRLTSVVRKKGVLIESAITNSFDAADRMTQQIQGVHPVGYGYDVIGSMTNVAYPSGLSCQYSYESRNLVESIRDNTTVKPIARYTYDAAGRLVKRKMGNGTECLYTYDAADRVIKIVLKKISSHRAGHDDDRDHDKHGKGHGVYWFSDLRCVTLTRFPLISFESGG